MSPRNDFDGPELLYGGVISTSNREASLIAATDLLCELWLAIHLIGFRKLVMQAAVFVGGQGEFQMRNSSGRVSGGKLRASKGFVRGQQFRVALQGLLEEGNCFLRPL